MSVVRLIVATRSSGPPANQLVFCLTRLSADLSVILLRVHDYFLWDIGGLGVACWPLVPKFAGSNPAETIGFLGRKNPQHAFFRRGSNAIGPMS